MYYSLKSESEEGQFMRTYCVLGGMKPSLDKGEGCGYASLAPCSATFHLYTIIHNVQRRTCDPRLSDTIGP